MVSQLWDVAVGFYEGIRKFQGMGCGEADTSDAFELGDCTDEEAEIGIRGAAGLVLLDGPGSIAPR